MIKYKDGGEYTGDFKDDMRDGIGVMKYADGNVYEGSWSKDLRHGHGNNTNGVTGGSSKSPSRLDPIL